MRERKTEGGEEGGRERSGERNKEIGRERQKNYVFLKIEMGKNEAWVRHETNKNKKTHTLALRCLSLVRRPVHITDLNKVQRDQKRRYISIRLGE